MAFEIIECITPTKPSVGTVPPLGVQVSARQLNSRSGKNVRYIRLKIGAKLASGISLSQPTQKVLLLFGSGEDAGKVRVAVPSQGIGFAAKRDRAGNYTATINAATAEGLFALEFPTFSVERCEPLRPTNGQSPHFVFVASPEMLAVED